MAEARTAMLQVLLVLVLGLALAPPLASGILDYWNFGCYRGNFTPGSIYKRNVELLAATLPHKVSSSPLLFATVTIGLDTAQVRALGECRRDVSSSVCKNCMTESFLDARKVCPLKKGVVLLKDYCSLWITDDPLNSDQETFLYNNGSGFQRRQEFENEVLGLTYNVTDQTVLSKNSFATGKQDLEEGSLFVLVQCAPTKGSSECRNCVRSLIDVDLFKEHSGGRMSNLWCELRWEMYKFYIGDPVVKIPLARSKGKGKRNRIIIWSLVGAAVVLMVLATIIIVWWKKRRLSANRIPPGGKFIQLVEECGEGGSGAVCQVECHRSALVFFEEILKMAAGRKIALFLDYDGTLSEIVNDAARAYMSEQMRDVVREAAELFDTSIVSGRSRYKVQDFVMIDGINYAGSHGLDIKMSAKNFAAGGELEINEEPFMPAAEYLPLMRNVIMALEQAVSGIQGATVEDNVFTASVHYRNVDEEHHPQVAQIVQEVLAQEEFKCLKLTTGQMVWEIRPPIKWHKGDAVVFLLKKLGLDDHQVVFPIYIGDDTTDEDAFEVLRTRNNGIGIVVSKEIRMSHAFFTVKNPTEVKEFLEMLVRWKRGE
ncbi:hypothetical protein EJB05_02739 [Eragrostis curvula]|uniref:Trehalose 6-phosphate phosphatase n=1 Tax=Eragrostis curvula TaxID=38414 RepID=A0A5J9WTA4_9POAL|nr:hypothetical protein EJB05_02739 [Eragrostis curvula]